MPSTKPFTRIARESQIERVRDKYEQLKTFIKQRLFKFKRYDQVKVNLIKSEIREKIEEINEFLNEWLKANIDIHYNKSFSAMLKKWEKLGMDEDNKVDPIEAKKNLRKKAKRRFKKANDSILKNVDEYFRLIKQTERKIKVQFLRGVTKPTDRIIKKGITAGASRNKISENIQDLYIKKFGKVDFIEIPLKGGGVRRYTPESYSEMVARTELKTAESNAIINATTQAGGDLIQFSQHGGSCEICAQYEGNIYSISGTHPVYPEPDIEIPVHPNCEHYWIPRTDLQIKSMKKAGKDVSPAPKLPLKEALTNIKKVRRGETKGIKRGLVALITTALDKDKGKDND